MARFRSPEVGHALPGAVHVLEYQQGTWVESRGLEAEAARDLAWGPTQVWIRLEGLEAGQLDSLGSVFNLHPLAVEDVRSHRQRPKVEDYDELTFVVVRAPRWDKENDEMSWLTVGVFLGPDFLITACTDPVMELDQVQKRLTTQKATSKVTSIDHVFYLVLDAIVDAYFPIMDDLEDRIEELEEAVFERPEPAVLEKIQGMKHIVSKTRKTIYPMREAMVALEKGEFPNVREETQIYLRDVADHTTRLAERLDHVKELALLAQETWNATLANHTNQTVRRLTLVTVALLVPNLIAQIFGMNLEPLPGWDFSVVAWGVVLLTAGIALVAMWPKKGA